MTGKSILLAAVLAAAAFGQASAINGQILGTVTDATGAVVAGAKVTPRRQTKRGSDWNKNFDMKDAPPIWRAGKISGRRRDEED